MTIWLRIEGNRTRAGQWRPSSREAAGAGGQAARDIKYDEVEQASIGNKAWRFRKEPSGLFCLARLSMRLWG
jgi:hypothetical protein